MDFAHVKEKQFPATIHPPKCYIPIPQNDFDVSRLPNFEGFFIASD
jgi:hypothetical protein